MKPLIYFDYNATTPVSEQVVEAMMPFFKAFYGNPSSLHRMGRITRGAVDTAREQVAALVGVSPSQVIFTSGGTEANNLAIRGLTKATTTGRIAVGATEHASVLGPVAVLEQDGWQVDSITMNNHSLLAKITSKSRDILYHTGLVISQHNGG